MIDNPKDEQLEILTDSHDDRYLIIEDDDNQHRSIAKNPLYKTLPKSKEDLDKII